MPAFRHRLDDIESKWEAIAPLRTCEFARIITPIVVTSPLRQVAPRCASGGIHFRAGDAASGIRGGSIDLLTSDNARTAGEARLCAIGERALAISAHDCLALNAGGGYRSSRIIAELNNCGVVLGRARNNGASLTLLSGRGHAATGGDVACGSGRSEVCAGGDIGYSAGRSSPNGGEATVTAGNGQMNSGSFDLLGASVTLGTEVGSLQSGDISLGSGRGNLNSGAVVIRSHCNVQSGRRCSKVRFRPYKIQIYTSSPSGK